MKIDYLSTRFVVIFRTKTPKSKKEAIALTRKKTKRNEREKKLPER
jgi:hypothetical protein